MKNYTNLNLILITIGVGLWASSTFLFNPRTVKIDEKHFACTAVEPMGLEARCVQYTWVKGVR